MTVSVYPCFSVCSYDSCDGSHAISLGDEAQSGDYSPFGEGSYLSWRQLLHLAFSQVTSVVRKKKKFSFSFICNHTHQKMDTCGGVSVYLYLKAKS